MTDRDMNKTLATTALALLAVLAAGALPALADGAAADDLAVVRHAVARSATAEAAPVREARSTQAEAAPAPPASARHRADPTWFRVRIVEKGDKGAQVKVNLPLFLVRALGDDIPLPGCDGHGKPHATVGEILRALDSGESLVEIEDDDTSVRVWVD